MVNFWAGESPYFGPRNSTSVDHIVHTENPMCSDMIEKIRLRLATFWPDRSQNSVSSGSQSSIQCGRPGGGWVVPVTTPGSAATLMQYS